MENKINIAELLKDCPKGMELDCVNYDGIVTFEEVSDCSVYPINISIKYGNESFSHTLTKYGQTCRTPYSKCVIFPKGKTTWQGFQKPFEDGDVIYNKGINALAIFYKQTDNITVSHCFLNILGELKICHYHSKDLSDWKFATEEEKQKLFDAIKANGYRWNPEIKTLEKVVEPYFKAGDKIKTKGDNLYWNIKLIEGDWYICTNGAKIHIGEQHQYELVPVEPKFKEGLVSIEKAAEWVKNSFKGTFGEGLAENIKQEFIKTMTK